MICKEEIDSLRECIGNKKVFLMGRGEHLCRIKMLLYSTGIDTCGIWDNDTNKQGSSIGGLMISAPVREWPNVYIIIYSPRHWESMYQQMISLGYDEESVYVLDRPSPERNRRMILHGMELYKDFCRACGADVQVFLASGPLGDYYLLGLFFSEYCHLHDIKNYLIAGDSKGISRLSRLLELSPVRELSSYDAGSLGELWKFAGRNGGVNIKPLTIWQGDFRFNPCVLRQAKGLTFMDTFRYMIFALHQTTSPKYPYWQYSYTWAEKFYEENKFQRDRTVLLVPFAYSMLSLPRDFWQNLTDMLLLKGYTVVVNVFGDGEENFIDGAAALSLDFSSVMDFMQYGAAVVGIRCGFFDITSQAKCKRIVLYPPRAGGNITWQKTSMDFCGLRAMGLCEDAHEWEVENIQELYPRILAVLENEVENE